MAPRAVLFQPLNHIGLGHINRLGTIAHALQELDNTIRTPFVIEEASDPFLDALGMPYVPLPSSHTLNDSVAWSPWTNIERSVLQEEISRTILKSIDPQVVVFDFLPNSIFAGEVRRANIPIVFCMREVRRLSDYLPVVRDLAEYSQLIIIPHSEGTISLPASLAAKSYCVGQIARRPMRVLSRQTDPSCTRIVISGGGGGYPGTVDFYNQALKATSILQEQHPKLKSQLITGPLFRDWRLLEPAEGIPVVPFEPDMLSVLSSADLVICQAGYNTVAELEQAGTKAVLVPAQRQWDDQFARGEKAERDHRNIFRLFRGKTASQLAQFVAEFLSESVATTTVATPDGARKAAQAIREIVNRVDLTSCKKPDGLKNQR